MTVYDRWHKTGPGEPCREHKRTPSAAHGSGLRWQVRYYNDEGRQRKRSFRLKDGRNPDVHADAFDAKVHRDLDTGDYTDPDDADITLAAYAEEWRKARSHDTVSAGHLERRLRLHVYQDPKAPGRTPKGGTAIGHRKLRDLAKRPSLLAAWVKSIPLAESSKGIVYGDVSAVFAAAAADGIIGRNPLRGVARPSGRRKARPWLAAQVAAMSAALPARYAVIPYLGAGTGMRQGETFGLAVDDVAFQGRDPRVHIVRQVKIVGGALRFAPVKNRKPHSAPLAPALALRLARHIELHPPVAVTLPWHDLKDREMHGQPVTMRLVLTDGRGRALNRDAFNRGTWRPALEGAGIAPRGRPAREHGQHVLRHTAASVWLRAGIDLVRVAAWLGDAPQQVLATYAHLMPDDDNTDGRAAVDEFSRPPGAPDVPAETGR